MRFTLVSHALCPYVQRVAIALAEKGAPFERRTVDLADKPRWFRAISPLGKTPLLIVRNDDGRETVLFESAVICEYLEETVRACRSIPQTRSTAPAPGAGSNSGSAILADLWGFETARDAPGFEAKRGALVARFATVEAAVAGPFFAGDRFTLVDATFAPIFRYFDVFDTIADTAIFAETPKVRVARGPRRPAQRPRRRRPGLPAAPARLPCEARRLAP